MSDPADIEWWVKLGIHTNYLIAGFAGGVVNAFVFKRADPISIIGSMVVGSFTANYLSEPIGRYLGTGDGPSGFIVGLAGMAICQGIVEAAKSWRPFRTNQDGTRPGT